MNEGLRAELLRRVAADQDARHSLDRRAMATVDGENLPWLRRVIAARMTEHRAPEPMRIPCGACAATIEIWPPDLGETRTATCPGCGLLHTFRSAD
jgi:hypothetical protein